MPLLFVNFINDMPSGVSFDTRIVVFADDAKLFRTISSTDDQVALQNDINTLNNGAKPGAKLKLVNVTMSPVLIINLVIKIYFLLLAKLSWYHLIVVWA